ncbi:unnamed protein product, partial [Polarella glacialis]
GVEPRCEVEEQVPEDEKRRRDDVVWQQQVAKALKSYTEAVAAAFTILSDAQQALAEAGIEQVRDHERHPVVGVTTPTAATAAALQTGFRLAQIKVARACDGIKIPLASHAMALAACMSVVGKADDAAAMLRHYESKLGGLEEEEADRCVKAKSTAMLATATSKVVVPSKDELRLDRNREKAVQAATSARLAQALARESLDSCMVRRGRLCSMAHDVVSGVDEAVRCVVGQVAQHKLPLATAGYASQSLAICTNRNPQVGSELIMGDAKKMWVREKEDATASNSRNPFEEDILVDEPVSTAALESSSGSAARNDDEKVERAESQPSEPSTLKVERARAESQPLTPSAVQCELSSQSEDKALAAGGCVASATALGGDAPGISEATTTALGGNAPTTGISEATTGIETPESLNPFEGGSADLELEDPPLNPFEETGAAARAQRPRGEAIPSMAMA